MYDTKVKFALDQFIQENYFLSMKNQYHLKEEQDSGKSDLTLNISNDNLCIYNFDGKGKCNFLRPEKQYGMQKSVDHVLFEKHTAGWRLHLIEMKSSVGYRKWLEIKLKMRTSYFTALAIADFLGIEFQETVAYTTYENEKFLVDQGTNPRAMMPQLGNVARDPFHDEWKKNRIILNVGEELILTHKEILMTRNAATGVLEGALTV